MTYRRRNKNKINKKLLATIVILSALFLFGTYIKEITQWFANPINSTKNVIVKPFSNSAEYFQSKKKLVEENDQLKKENRRLEIENLTFKSLKKENKSLRNLVQYQENEKDLFVAKVINQPPFSPYDTFVIDLGNNFTKTGDKVYYLDVLIGEIEEVYLKSAVVRLYSSPNKNIFVSINDQQTEATGIGAGGFVISLPKDIEISDTETVYVEKNAIGKVDEIKSDQTGAFQNIYFRYPFNINNIDFVQVTRTQI